jgi:hypothetical protein
MTAIAMKYYLLLPGLLWLAGCVAARPELPMEIPPNGVLRHEFGQIAAGAPLSKTFVIANPGPQPIGLQAKSASCSCLASPAAGVITAGKSLAMDARVDTRALRGPVEIVAVFATTEPDRPDLQLVFSGEVIPPVRVRPEVLYFGQLTPGANRVRRIQIEPSGPEQRIRRIRSASGRLGLRQIASPSKLTKEKRVVTLEVTLPRGLGSGGFEDRLLIETNDPSLQVYPVPVLAILLPN